MGTSPIGRRTSFTFYDATKTALASLEKELRKSGLEADRTDIVRALVHGVPENEILARGILQDLFERSPAGADLGVGEFVPIRMNPDDYAKLERVAARAKKIEINLSVGVLVRGLAMSNPTLERLTAMVREVYEDIPDGRALRWQKR